MTADPPAGVPLARIFAMAFRSLIDQLHAALADRGWPAVRSPYGFVLVAVRDGPTTAADLTALLGMTKQATAKVVDAMEDDGYVHRLASGDDARAKLIQLTDRGRRLLADVEAVYADLEAGWAEALGRDRVEAIRADLLTVLRAENGGELPPVRPTW